VALTGAPTAPLDESQRPYVDFGLARGALVGRYVIVDRLGAGGMGAVYVAYDAQLARRVAVKVLRPGISAFDARARLLREAQTMAQLTHPNVLAVYDVGAYQDGVFIATEYIVGRTMKEWMREPRSWREVLGVASAAGRGLAAAHAAGIVHRDFKPDNVFLGNDGRVVVGDFGIARALQPKDHEPVSQSAPGPKVDVPAPPSGQLPPSVPPSSETLLSANLTQEGAITGTVGYMPPECAKDATLADPRSDQFGFAVTLYRALYGQPPFVYKDLPSYLSALLDPPRPPPAGSRVPSWVHAIVMRGLAFEPSARFASMSELLEALGRDPTRRRRAWAAGAFVAVVAAGGALGWAQHERHVREECGAGEQLMATTWGPEAHARVGASISASGAPLAGELATRSQAALDAYATEWARVYREASEATLLRHQESTATLTDRLACLEGERDEVAAVVDVLSHADAVVATHSINAAYGLAPPRTCLEEGAARAASLGSGTAEHRARILAVRRALAEADAKRMTGKLDEAVATATSALTEARGIPHPQLEAQLLFLLAACKRELEDDAVARVTFEEAFAAAEAAGNDSLAAMAAAAVSLELGDSLADTHEARRWLAIAKGIRAREMSDDRADADILEAELSLVGAEGHVDETLPLRDRLIALLERIYGASHPKIAAAIANRANALGAIGRTDQGIEEGRKAIAMQERLFGPAMPWLAIYYNNLGSSLMDLGRFPEAKEALEHALALIEPLGPSNPHKVLPLVSMAQLENLLGEHDRALAAAAQGIAIVDSSGDSEVRFLPALLVQKGIALLAKGDPSTARLACRRALERQEKEEILGPDKVIPDGEDALACLGDAELALGHTGEAVKLLERTVSMTKRHSALDLALARFSLARALTSAKTDPARARALAKQAAAGLRAAPGMAREAERVEAWLARP
jgi:tetratricopeptide (TPR) repeat protein